MSSDFVPDANLYPFTSRWFDSTVGRLHYIDEGLGAPILFLHGAPTWSFLYRDVVRRLSGQFRCIAVDLPGFGLSSRPSDFGYSIAEMTAVIGEFIDGLRLDGYLFMGHDWGGPIGLGASVERADRVRGVILANTVFWPVDRFANRAFSAVMGSAAMRRRILERNFLIEKFLLGNSGPRLSDLEAEHYRAVQPDSVARRALAVMPGQIRSARPLLAGLAESVPTALGNKPALAVWGMRDQAFPPRWCFPRIRSAFADLEVFEVDHANHFVPEEAPQEIATAIERRFSACSPG